MTQNDLPEEIVKPSININMDDNGQEVNLVEVDSNNSMTPKMILVDR